MSDDLIIKLRTYFGSPLLPVSHQAANEIERLNAENARLREAMEEYVNTVVKMEVVTFVEYMENAELRAVVESILAEKEK